MVQSYDDSQHDLPNWEITAEESTRINRRIDNVDSVSPSVEIMEAIKGTYQYLKDIIESSETIRKQLKGDVSLQIYGSVVNGLFDI